MVNIPKKPRCDAYTSLIRTDQVWKWHYIHGLKTREIYRLCAEKYGLRSRMAGYYLEKAHEMHKDYWKRQDAENAFLKRLVAAEAAEKKLSETKAFLRKERRRLAALRRELREQGVPPSITHAGTRAIASTQGDRDLDFGQVG
jgi:hypothetical protein